MAKVKSAAEESAAKRRRSRTANLRRGHVTVAGVTRMAKQRDANLTYLARVQLKIFQDHIIEDVGEKAAAVTAVRGAKTISLPSVVTALSWVLGKGHCKTIRTETLSKLSNKLKEQKSGQTCKVF
tara:strand:- start:209 stop:583 length:375 start_codon:yes stop_codon:yes gene_type:complete